MSSVTAVVKEIELDLSNIPREQRKEAKDEVRAFLLEEVLRSVESGNSPVQGEGRFRTLTPDYARKEKGGNRTANLELEGDLLNALDTKNLRGNKIEIGVRGKEAPKADGHNQISGEAKAWASRTGRSKYKRRFIPDDNQTFVRSIRNGIDEILDTYRVDPEAAAAEVTVPSAVTETEESVQIEVSDLFSEESIEALFLEAQRNRDGN